MTLDETKPAGYEYKNILSGRVILVTEEGNVWASSTDNKHYKFVQPVFYALKAQERGEEPK